MRDRGRPLRRRDQRRRRRRRDRGRARAGDLPRPAAAARGRASTGLADGYARPWPPRGREAERRSAPRASRRDISRSRSSTRRSAASRRPARRARHRPATGASTSSSPRWRWRPRSVSCARWHPAYGGRARRCASSAWARGHPWRDHRGHRAGAAGAPRSGATRPGSPPTSPPAPSWSVRSPRPMRSPTSPGSPTRRRPGSRSGSPAPGASEGSARRLPEAAPAPGGCLVICGWEGEASRCAASGSPAALLRAGGRCRSGRPRAGLGAGPVRGPLPARRAARPRLHGRDARDRPHLVAARRALRGGRRGARRARCATKGPRGS